MVSVPFTKYSTLTPRTWAIFTAVSAEGILLFLIPFVMLDGSKPASMARDFLLISFFSLYLNHFEILIIIELWKKKLATNSDSLS